MARAAAPSALQREVAAALAKLGYTVQEEVRIKSGYSLDAVIGLGGAPVGVEADGPSHFIGRAPTGATLLKRRQLRIFGWRLVSVRLARVHG